MVARITMNLAQEIRFIHYARLLVVSLLFVFALVVRIHHINEPPLDFHATRQYRSLIIARAYYFQTTASLPEWQKQVASINAARQGILEPPIMELLVSSAYRLVGREYFWIPGLLSSLFWIVGAGFLYLLASKLANAEAALFSAAFYLFLPFSVTASRSFQPDPLMIMMLLASIYAVVRYYEQPSTRGLAITSIASAAAAFIKPLSLFVIVSVFVSLAIATQAGRCHKAAAKIIGTKLAIFLLVALLP